jgi:hypothetical protein
LKEWEGKKMTPKTNHLRTLAAVVGMLAAVGLLVLMVVEGAA